MDSTTVDYYAPWNGQIGYWYRGEKQYELTNHLGNVMVTVSDNKPGVAQTSNSSLIDHYAASVVNANDYYPFGMLMQGRNITDNRKYSYGFNGKEKDDEAKGQGNQIDYGARVYDPRAGRFLSVEALQMKYPNSSPYSYLLNSPIQGTDPDGSLVIFINGFWGFGTGASNGGNKEYWSFSGGHGDWADKAMQRIGDYNARYYDGSNGGLWKGNPQREILASERILNGYKMGQKEASSIIASLRRDPNDPNKIVESIKFITNSFGTAYEKGFSTALQEYVDNYNKKVLNNNNEEIRKSVQDPKYKMKIEKPITGFQIEFTVDLAPFQGEKLTIDPNAKNNYFMRSKIDWISGYEGAKIKGSKEIGLDSNGHPISQGHHASFFPTSQLPKSINNSDIKKDVNQSN